ncbi:hypothetical protein Taro_021460 [Colocasia esculenta]|uniref:Uncharacterized protein n=1 Tax=Colocasia esculenta TaxID=4460 RepID=A0A843V532_COLES|nr:hypothetical protein [Colocasia esculenta]
MVDSFVPFSSSPTAARNRAAMAVAGAGNDGGEGWSKSPLRRPEVAGPGSDGGEEASSAMAEVAGPGSDGGDEDSSAMADVAGRGGQRWREFRGRKTSHIAHVPCQARTVEGVKGVATVG